jgi:N-acyl-D-amino-acid deacylase
MFKTLICVISVILVSCFACTVNAHDTAITTQLIRNAMIIDGSGLAGHQGDVRFDEGGIIAVGSLEALDTDTVIDAKGMVLSPGFIDSHSHHDSGLDSAPLAVAAVSQGITTIVVGNDGGSDYPLENFKQQLETIPPAVNVASYTGHGSIRSEVMGGDFKREATVAEISQMQALLSKDLASGSLGLATGLEYDPGIYSSTDEVIMLAKTTSAAGGRYISHMRSEDRSFFEAVEELLQIGEEAQLPVQISHIKLAAVNIWGQSGDLIRRLDEAREQGIDVTADIYPYTYWESTLTVLLPDRDFNNLDAARYALENLAPADGLTLTVYAPDPSLAGKTVAEIATARGKSNEETYLQLIRDAYEGLSVEETASLEERRESVIGVSMSEADIAKLIAWPHTNICSDGASDGHPRGHGAFPRAIRKYVREQGVVTLEEMIRKMTSLSADHLGISDRGLIKPGYAADLVLFDPETITDNATIAEHDLLSDGISGVWVNGERVWKNKQPTGATPGEFVTH